MTSMQYSPRLSDSANDSSDTHDTRLTTPNTTQGTNSPPSPSMSPNILVVHTSLLFDPKLRSFLNNMSIEVDSETGSIVRLFKRESIDIPLPDSANAIDLRGKFVLPGFVDSHTHIFLHSYKQASPSLFKTHTPY